MYETTDFRGVSTSERLYLSVTRRTKADRLALYQSFDVAPPTCVAPAARLLLLLLLPPLPPALPAAPCRVAPVPDALPPHTLASYPFSPLRQAPGHAAQRQPALRLHLQARGRRPPHCLLPHAPHHAQCALTLQARPAVSLAPAPGDSPGCLTLPAPAPRSLLLSPPTHTAAPAGEEGQRDDPPRQVPHPLWRLLQLLRPLARARLARGVVRGGGRAGGCVLQGRSAPPLGWFCLHLSLHPPSEGILLP